jgi:short-subunit dehydrogenase
MNTIAVITGGSSGLGLELAFQLVNRGCNTCIIGRDAKRLQDAVTRLKSAEGKARVLSLAADVGSENCVKALSELLDHRDFVPSLIFNIAGVGRFGDVNAMTEERILEVFRANTIGLMLMSSYGVRAMQERGGVIVNVMSTAALVGRPKESIYCAAKWAARGFTEALKAATKGTAIRVVSVFPGGMKTPFWSDASGMTIDTSSFMDPSQVAARILAAATEMDSSWVSEITIERR